jgi:hypothetical protein
VRQRERDAFERPLAEDPQPDNPTAAGLLGDDDRPVDWRELGNRVLAEAQRRSMRAFRRRNGGGPKIAGGQP